MNNKVLMDLAAQMGITKETADAKAKEYMAKSDEDILKEIEKLKDSMKGNPGAFERQLQAVKLLSTKLNGPQKERLDKIMEMLKK